MYKSLKYVSDAFFPRIHSWTLPRGPYSITNVTFLSKIFILNCRNIRLSNLAGACVVICFLCRIILYLSVLKFVVQQYEMHYRIWACYPSDLFPSPNESAVLVLCLDTCVWCGFFFVYRLFKSWIELFCFEKKLINARVQSTNSCSSADETEDGELDPDVKAQREKERRQANNARERWELSCLVLWPIFLYVFQYCFGFPLSPTQSFKLMYLIILLYNNLATNISIFLNQHYNKSVKFGSSPFVESIGWLFHNCIQTELLPKKNQFCLGSYTKLKML